jgi:hypothetical protein
VRVVAIGVVTLAACGRLSFTVAPLGDATLGDDVLGDGATSSIMCVSGYVPVEPLAGYTTQPFCVAKYEMRNVGGVATSTAQGTPWLQITTNQAMAECQALGYELVTNPQWQTMARQMADEGWNWSSSVAYQGVMSTGHSDSGPAIQIEASTDDNPCANTGQTCSDTEWHAQRRTAKLANGSVLWDLAGNAGEWVNWSYGGGVSSDERVAELASSDPRRNEFGNDQVCPNPNASPWCGFGMAFFNQIDNGTARGQGLDWGNQSGVFSVVLWLGVTEMDWNVGFRCAYEP